VFLNKNLALRVRGLRPCPHPQGGSPLRGRGKEASPPTLRGLRP